MLPHRRSGTNLVHLSGNTQRYEGADIMNYCDVDLLAVTSDGACRPQSQELSMAQGRQPCGTHAFEHRIGR